VQEIQVGASRQWQGQCSQQGMLAGIEGPGVDQPDEGLDVMEQQVAKPQPADAQRGDLAPPSEEDPATR
jgi:hypothetical protein